MSHFSGIAGDIEAVIGFEATVALLRARGGTDVELPRRVSGSWLARLIGDEAAHAMVREFGHGRMSLPMGGVRGRAARDAAIRAQAMEMIDAGHSNSQIALDCGLSLRTVEKYRAQSRHDDNQPTLPLF